MLDDEGLARVSEAIREAERATSGEIVVVIDRVAAHYTSLSISLAFVLGLLSPWPLIAFTNLGVRQIFLFQLTLTAVFLALCLWYGRNGRFVPRFFRRRHAHSVAQREFLVRGLSRTRERTGILIYVALAERYAEVLADTGIAERVQESQWKGIIEEIVTATTEERLAEGLVGAVGQAGRLLAANFPPRDDDRDELSNKVIVI